MYSDDDESLSESRSNLRQSSSSSFSSTSTNININNDNNNNLNIIDKQTTIQIGDHQIGSTSFELISKQYDSWWHDVPLKPATTTTTTINYNNNAENFFMVVNMVVEIPYGTRSKMEMDKFSKSNPIKHDLNKDGSLRYYTYGQTFFNYGFIPQTWEDPSDKGHYSGYGGDNDPIDIIEIGLSTTKPLLLKMGSIIPCRIIGGYELIDQNEIDYKIICISVAAEDEEDDDERIQSIDDLSSEFVTKLKDWFINYKTTDGKPPNQFAGPNNNNLPLTASEAMDVVLKTHDSWYKKLCNGNDPKEQQHKNFWLSSRNCRGR